MDPFAYVLFIVGLIAAVVVSVIAYKTKKKVRLNPGAVLLSALFFMALWLYDLSVLTLFDAGINATAGLTQTTGRIPFALIAALTMLAMVIIAVFNYFYNKKTKGNDFNNFISITQIIGLITLTIFGGLYSFGIGLFGGIHVQGLYHSGLPLVIFSELILMLNMK